ncbi:hypothetical protein [Nitrospirillum viridazoti]|uniref:Uncharacterized protein n=1 Tax=Nitrospirillum viridazoti CBAmc TaxID=1441467 RepID=A0A248JWM6_9PROT|nr:hypothetical protein [Nitrospirillum amazonense]ASG22926.1 hypothetical protein Y958_18735 [Nitrospirillum amazonense CBAmc]TWB31461.1 hypothetical protein FBZ91_11955 [Nitrospirillum amazonense]
MTHRILIVGQDPDTVDFTAPGIIPGMTADKVRAGVTASKQSLEGQGYSCDNLYVQPAPAVAETEVAAALSRATYDVVVIGAGIRNPPANLILLETVLNTIHRVAPHSRIAFNTRPDDTDAAAVRWLGR